MIAIIHYQGGNIASLKNALERIGQPYILTSKPKEILEAKGVIFPGQGRAGQSMQKLVKTGIAKIIPKIKKPFLGICLGAQLLTEYSEEDEIKCFKIFKTKTRKFPPTLKIPHIGWNRVELIKPSPLLKGIKNRTYFYFVHSYYIDYIDALSNQIIGKTSYGFDFISIIQKNNFFGVQFHPEKSGREGLRLLNNFCKLCLD